MIDRDFEQVSEEHMKSMTKPEGPAQEPRFAGLTNLPDTACPCGEIGAHPAHAPATPAPSQPAGAREGDAEEMYRVSRRGFAKFKAALTHQLAAKDAEHDKHVAELQQAVYEACLAVARECGEPDHSIDGAGSDGDEIEFTLTEVKQAFNLLRESKVVAERKRDSLREALGQILTALKGSDSNRFHCIEVAEKALAGWTGLNQPPAVIGCCDTPHWLDKPTKDRKALQQTPHPLEAGCRQWVACKAENAALKAGKETK